MPPSESHRSRVEKVMEPMDQFYGDRGGGGQLYDARAAQREAQAKAAQKEIAEFTADFLNAARKCFQMIDKDNSGLLSYYEVLRMTRDLLKIPESKLKEAELLYVEQANAVAGQWER